MAKQCGITKITGTIDWITFYKMGDEYYARKKSSLSAKRVKKDPAFSRTMEEANLFGRSSKLAAKLKVGLTREERKKIRHGKLTAQVKQLLVAGKTEQEIFDILRPDLIPAVTNPIVKQTNKQEEKLAFAEASIRNALADEKENAEQLPETADTVNSSVTVAGDRMGFMGNPPDDTRSSANYYITGEQGIYAVTNCAAVQPLTASATDPTHMAITTHRLQNRGSLAGE
ncbi:MAG TPA: hypothetical protein VFV08_02230 [Puia sp.]|nr:hypothetical protein [Puia sp.]